MKHLKKLEEDKDANLEQNLLIESAEREERLSKQLTSLEIELSKTKHELKQTYAENEKLSNAHQELIQECEQLKDVLSKQKSEIKTLKERENRLLVDNTELDGENVQLQEQIAKLKEELVELDTIKHENKALEERLEALDSQIVELTQLKRIVEKQLEEQLNSFREEREYKYQKKREVNEMREKQTRDDLINIANKLIGINYDSDDVESDDPPAHHHHDHDARTAAVEGESFMSEVNTVNELQVLEKKLDDLNKHKEQLETELNEFKDDLNLSLNGVSYINKRLTNYVKHQSADNNNSQQQQHHHNKDSESNGTLFLEKFKEEI